LKDIKSKISANFIHYDNKKIIITTNKAMTTLDLNIVKKYVIRWVSQIRYSLVVILELSGVSEVQYKKVMMIDDGKYQ